MKSQPNVTRVIRLFLALGALVGCILAIVNAGKAGFSRHLTDEALAHGDLDSANAAVKLSPEDPEGYHTRGLLLSASNRYDEAIESLEEAVRLRSSDRYWLDLGSTYEAKGDFQNAANAFAEAVRLAPYYAQPHWRLGSSLLSLGLRENAMRQFRIAAKSDPTLLPKAIDQAWKGYSGSPQEVLRVLEPQNDRERVKLAAFFVEQNQMSEGLSLLRLTGSDADYDRHVLTIQLIEKNRFRDAAEVINSRIDSVKEGTINEGDFELGTTSVPGFGWQFMREPRNTRIAIDQERPSSGSRSLAVSFNGAVSEETEFVKQLILVAPRTRYSLEFATRSQDLQSDSRPLIAVVDANPGSHFLATSEPAKSGTADWSTQRVDFQTTDRTEAVYLIVRPQKCPSETCLIFGRVWFDNFILRKN